MSLVLYTPADLQCLLKKVAMATRAFSHDTGPLQLCLILCSTVSGWFESYPRLALTLLYLAFFINEIRMPFFPAPVAHALIEFLVMGV